MVQLLERITRPVRGLHQAAYVLAGLTLASQVLALLRDRVFAHTFGAGEVLDLYYVAFKIPDIVFALVSSLVSAYVLIPRIASMEREGVRRLLSESMTFLIGLGGTMCAILAFFTPQMLSFFYPDFSTSAHYPELIFLSRLLLLQPILLGLSGVLASVTQVHRRFTLFAISPVLYNLGIIGGALFGYPLFGLPGIGFGVIIGALAYLSVNIPVLISASVTPRLTLPTWSVMRSVLRDSIPRSLALGMGSLTALVLIAFASRIGTGAVSVFTFASNLEAVPLALIGSSYAVAAFPALSEAIGTRRHVEFVRILLSSARHIILWSLVALGLVAVLRAHIVRVVLGTGAFDWDATRLTAALLVVLAVGLVAQGLSLLFSRALYAARQSWRPLFYQLAAGILTVCIAALLLFSQEGWFPTTLANILRVGDVSGTAVLLIALASTVGQLLLAVLCLTALASTAPGLIRSLVNPFLEGGIAAFTGGCAAYAMLFVAGSIAPLTTLAFVFIEGSVAGVVGLCAAGLTLYLLRNEEFLVMMHAMNRLFHTPQASSAVLTPSAEDPSPP